DENDHGAGKNCDQSCRGNACPSVNSHQSCGKRNEIWPLQPIQCRRTATSFRASFADISYCRRTLTYGNVGERRHSRHTMLVRTSTDLGAIIRDRRKRLKLDQSSFAKRIGVSRQWVIEVEHGHARAELGLVLRALDALGISLDANSEQSNSRSSEKSGVDINAIVAKAKKRRA
ncbi:helix-turn-helix transcriptional regulator, partial [Bradyrhizobium sp. 23AC]